MGRKREKTQVINNIQNLNLEIDYDKLAESIVKATEIEKQREEQEKAAALEKWRAEVGYNDHGDKKGFAKKFFCCGNYIKVAWNIMFISKKKHIATSPTSAFIQGLISSLFALCKWVLTIIAIIFVVIIFYHPESYYGFNEYFAAIFFAIFSFMLSRIFRLMAIEIDQMSNREQILGVFTAVIALIQLGEKIVALFKGVG